MTCSAKKNKLLFSIIILTYRMTVYKYKKKYARIILKVLYPQVKTFFLGSGNWILLSLSSIFFFLRSIYRCRHRLKLLARTRICLVNVTVLFESICKIIFLKRLIRRVNFFDKITNYTKQQKNALNLEKFLFWPGIFISFLYIGFNR